MGKEYVKLREHVGIIEFNWENEYVFRQRETDQTLCLVLVMAAGESAAQKIIIREIYNLTFKVLLLLIN